MAPGRGVPTSDVPPGPMSTRLDAYDDAETYGIASSDTAYLDSVVADTALRADMTNARALREKKSKSKRIPVKELSTVNNALAVMYAEEHYFEDEQALARAAASYRFEDEDPSVRFSDDRRASDKDATEGAGVWTLDERRASALEALRALQRWKQALHAHSAAAPAYVRAAPRSDLGDADKSEWIPHVFADGGGSVAWFKSRDAMTASERARADAAADWAEGKSHTEKNATDAPNDARRENKQNALVSEDVERVVRVTRRAEDQPIGAHRASFTATGGERDPRGEPEGRPRGVRAEGRRAAAAPVPSISFSFPAGGVRAARGLPHEPPDARARVVERFVAADARGDLVDAAVVDADAGRRPDADDLVAEETTTQTTRETRTRTVTMDADGNVLDEKETVETEAVGAAPRTTNTVPSAAETTAEPDDAAFDALTLTEGQIDVVVDLLRENHGVDVDADELRDLLARVRTRKKYRGVESKAWQETEKGKDE